MPAYVEAAEGYFEYLSMGDDFFPPGVPDGGLAFWGEAAVS